MLSPGSSPRKNEMLSPTCSPLMRPRNPGPGKQTLVNSPKLLVPRIVRALAHSPPPMDEPEPGEVGADTPPGRGTTASESTPITTGKPVSGTTDAGRAAYGATRPFSQGVSPSSSLWSPGNSRPSSNASSAIPVPLPRVSPSSSSSWLGNSRPSSSASSATAVVQPCSPPSTAASPRAASASSMPMRPDPAPAQPVVHRLVDDTHGVYSPTEQVGTPSATVLKGRRIRVQPREGANSAEAAMACVYDVLDTLQAMKLAIRAAQQESGDSLNGVRTATAPMFAHYRVLQAPGSRS